MNPLNRDSVLWGLVGTMVVAASASAATRAATRVDVGQGPLQGALAELARETGAELLFDEALVRDLKAKSVRGRLTSAEALSMLLAGTGVGYRMTPDGAFVLFRLPPRVIADPGDGAIAEVLVIGRRTQNADIRRTENDIQPYRVFGLRELTLAPQDNLDQFLRARLPANAQAISPGQNVFAGPATNSAVDMRGVGTQRTLVLIDGRRVPGLPTEAAGFDQGDFNAIPLGAVERVETLTSTAGGIHGPSAVGGVVNVVLRRDYRGADLTVVSGLSDRGDAGRVRFEGRIGFSPDEGRTDVMLFASYATAQSFHASDRDYARRALRRQTANSPATFLAWSVAADAVIVRSTTGAPLRLDPALGGATLSSSYTFLPIDFTGSPETRVAALLANSGKLPTNPPPGRAGERMSLAATPEVGSVLLNVRHKLSDRFELFADGLYFSNRGRAFTPNATTQGFTPANAPTNPFTDFVLFSFPTPDLFTERDASIKVRRFSGGLIASLPRSWQASADYTIGRTILHTDFYSRRPGSGVVQSLGNGLAGANGLPAIAPLGDFTTLQTAISSQSSDTVILTRLTNHFRDATVRAAGPLVTLPAGPLTLTLLGEFRREHIPQSERFGLSNGVFAPSVTPARTQAVRSGYVEVRAPLVPRDAVFVLARGLELQLALRRDDVRTTFPENVLAGATFDEGRTTIRHEASVFTVGGRAFPAPWLMLRGSLATGEAPPDLRHLQERAIRVAFDNPSEPRDPRRGGRRLTQDGPYLWIRGGSHDIAQEKGRTMSAGVVLNPSGRDGPRVSVDYSRIDVRDEIVAFPLTVQQLMDLESRYPDRVEREPLSAADAALGYTVGRVTALHTGLINAGRSVADAVDIQLDWTLPPTTQGQARIYGAATWQPRLRSRIRDGGPLIERAGYRDGPLKWRGNAGLEWTRGPLTIDLNVQYLGSHRVASSAADIVLTSPERIAFQGATRIPSQVYVDLVARRRFELGPDSPLRAVEVRLGVQNLLDRSPPIVADPNNLGYDYYGDPRRRRFELLLSAKF